MLDSGIFTSTSISTVNGVPVGNKAKNTAFMALLFEKLAGADGISINPSSSFYVQPKTGLTFTVNAGWGIMKGYPFKLAENLDITVNSSTSDQTFYIGVRLDTVNGEYTGNDVVARTTFVSGTDRAFAKIVLPANAVTITPAMVTDLRYNANYCGTIDEWKVALADIYAEYRDALVLVNAGGIPAHATNHYVGGNDPVTKRFTIPVTATWSGSSAPYTQQITVEGMIDTMVGTPTIVYANSDTLAAKIAQATAFGLVSDVETGNGSITLTCFKAKPLTAFTMVLEVIL